jgi:hypothetical protein
MRLAPVLCVVLAVLAPSLVEGEEPPAAKAIVAHIAAQLDHHPLVMIGELHRFSQLHAFMQQLVRDPRFICRVDDVVVEFGNSRYQDVVDAWAAGASVPEARLQAIWRETVVPFTWNSPLYRQFLETVRDVNLKHLCRHPIRILLGDPPLDWSKIRGPEDLAAFDVRDGNFAAVVEREVLAKHHRAFLLAGLAHALKRQPKPAPGEPEGPAAAELLERKHPGALFCIAPVRVAADAAELRLGPIPAFELVRGSALEPAAFGKYLWKEEPPRQWPPMAEVVDAVLWVGEPVLTYPSPKIYLEPGYLQELRRRVSIIKEWNGQDFVTTLDELVEQARRAP